MKDTTQLYIYPASYVREHGELEQYRASYKANIACNDSCNFEEAKVTSPKHFWRCYI